MERVVELLDQTSSVVLLAGFLVAAWSVWVLRTLMSERPGFGYLLGLSLCLLGAGIVFYAPKELEMQRIFGPALFVGLGLLVMNSALTTSGRSYFLRERLARKKWRLAIAERAHESRLAEMAALQKRKLSSRHKLMQEEKMQGALQNGMTRVRRLKRQIERLERRLENVA